MLGLEYFLGSINNNYLVNGQLPSEKLPAI